MSTMNKPVALASAALILSTSLAFAQAVGGNNMPTDAKKQGTMENGSSSTGMSKEEATGGMKKQGSMESGSSMKSGGSMKKDDKM